MAGKALNINIFPKLNISVSWKFAFQKPPQNHILTVGNKHRKSVLKRKICT